MPHFRQNLGGLAAVLSISFDGVAFDSTLFESTIFFSFVFASARFAASAKLVSLAADSGGFIPAAPDFSNSSFGRFRAVSME